MFGKEAYFEDADYLRRWERGREERKLVGRDWEINYTKEVSQSLKQLWHKVIAGW